MIASAWLIPFLPLLGAAVCGIAGGRMGRRAVGLTACLAVGISFAISLAMFAALPGSSPGSAALHDGLTLQGNGAGAWHLTLFTWIESGIFRIDISLLLDPLSVLMILVVTGVGFLIHVYSIGYMKGDPGYHRYFSYLNLFVFFMLMLVLGGNYFVMFLGWEGVGLCSYLLIGFWYEKKSASDAGKKAFIVNRIGDFGFLLGLFLLFWSLSSAGVHSLEFLDVFANLHLLGHGTLFAIAMLLFVGAIGKSAQIPLYVWLPDAMEGPTPVSALIHAATMVTAGVYMVARNSALFTMVPLAGQIVATVGILTAFFAATIALTQNDIKRVLAYSTISQLGYMFAAVGLGAYVAGMFHLMTHAFFKGLLFLGAGSVIHAMGGTQDMRKMGGLFSSVKVTAITFIVGAIAIAGIPPFAGFWSKDEILWEAFHGGHYIIWFIGLLTASITAFYMFRQVFMVFFGDFRGGDETLGKLHESPKMMTVPLMILAVLAFAGGFVGIPFIKGGSAFHHYLNPVFATASHAVSGHGKIPSASQATAGHGEIASASQATAGHGEIASAAQATVGHEELASIAQTTPGHDELTASGAAASDTAVPYAAVSDAAVPDVAAPDVAVPDAAAPDAAAPASAGPVAVGHGEFGTAQAVLMAISVLAALLGVSLAAVFYYAPLRFLAPRGLSPGYLAKRYEAVYDLLLNKYRVDELYDAYIVGTVRRFATLSFWFDLVVIDGLVNGAGWLARVSAWFSHRFDIYIVDGIVNSFATLVDVNGRVWRRLSTGFLQNYALLFILGVILILGGVLFVGNI